MKSNWLNLSHLGVIQISGEGAKKLLQGQLTCDLEFITEQQASLGALCNIKGRAICGFYLGFFNAQYYLIIHRSLVNKTLSTLKKYAVFFPTTLIDVSDTWHLIGLIGDNPEMAPCIAETKLSHTEFFHSHTLNHAQGFYIQLPSHNTSPRYIFVIAPEAPMLETIAFHPGGNNDLWEKSDIENRLTLLDEHTSEKFIPLELGYEKREGISFKKGCYTGQEVIARIHYRGQLKSHLQIFKLSHTDDALHLTEKDIHTLDHQIVGQVISSIKEDKHTIGLALIRDEAQQQALWIDDMPCQLLLLDERLEDNPANA